MTSATMSNPTNAHAPHRHAAPVRLAVLAAVLALAACSRPQPPEKERRPDPQATQLRDAIQAPQDKARAVEDEVQEAADAQRAAIEAQGG